MNFKIKIKKYLLFLAVLIIPVLIGCSSDKNSDPKFSASLEIELKDRISGYTTKKIEVQCPNSSPNFNSICPQIERAFFCPVQTMDISGEIESYKSDFCDSKPSSGTDSFIPTLSPDLPNQACTELYGGPEVVLVQGKINGESIDFQRTRVNGCEIAEYDFWTTQEG